MLKIQRVYVSLFEFEEALIMHPDVLDGSVIGVPVEQDLSKPKAAAVRFPAPDAWTA